MGNGLDQILKSKKATIAKKWFEAAVQTYAPDAAHFFGNNSDPFANPVGGTTRQSLGGLLDELFDEMDPAAVAAHLDPVIRIRAVQGFTPSQATAFILLLKMVLREQLAKELRDHRVASELVALESKIDRLCLTAFDIYMQCREKLYQISANETRNRTFRAFARAGLISETPDEP